MARRSEQYKKAFLKKLLALLFGSCCFFSFRRNKKKSNVHVSVRVFPYVVIRFIVVAVGAAAVRLNMFSAVFILEREKENTQLIFSFSQ